MKQPSALVCRIALLLAAAATVGAGAAPASEAPAAARGAELLLPFKQQLQAALAAGLAEGPVEAIGVCRDRAPQIAADLSVDGVSMGRASHRLRNPANAPPAWAEPLLARYLAGVEARSPAAVPIGEGRVGYVEPITVQPQCLGCHGSTPAPGIADKLTELYPDDQATGFAAGDFRGLFWVEFPAPD
jgi:hypothetical protein